MRRVALWLVVVAGILGPAPAAQAATAVLSISDAAPVVEGNSGSRNATFTVTRSGDTSTAIRYGYNDCCSTGDPGVDHDVVVGNVFMGAGDTTDTITVGISGDTAVEPDQTFGVSISAIEGDISISRDTGFARIVDDDGRPAGTVIDVGDPSPVTEGGPSATTQVVFPLTLSNAGTVPMTIHYATENGTAGAGEDFVATSGDVTFTPGQTTKAVPVTITGDDRFEGNESFRLVLSNPTAAGPGRAGTATIVEDDPEPPPPPPPPPPPAAEHTLLGVASYEPAYGPGFDGLEVLGPFAVVPSPREVTIRLRNAGGAIVRAFRASPRADGAAAGVGTGGALGPVPYRFDDLEACAGCVVELLGDSTVQDSWPVSFDGEAGQTDIDLSYGRLGRGGVLTGTVLAPSGTLARDLSVAVLDASGKTLADTSTLRYKCGGSATACPVTPSYVYRLVGLPASGRVRLVLRQGPASRKAVDVDSADVALDPSGATDAPDLTAVADLPSAVSGRTLYGQINNTAPFAPGARKASDLDLSERELDGLEVQLRAADGAVRARTRGFTRNKATGYVTYALAKLDACSGCAVALVDGKKTFVRLPVTIPSASPSVTRRDLDYARDGEPEFMNGTVIANDVRAKRLVVTVTDAGTGKRLATSGDGDAACRSGARCLTGGDQAFRIGSIPPDRDVVVTLMLDNRAADSRRLRTSPAGEVTQVPALVVPRGKGPRSLQVQVTNEGPYAPGRTVADPPKSFSVTGRLLGSTGAEVARASARLSQREDGLDYNALFLDALPACAGCTLELVTPDGVEDRAPVDVRSETPSVAIASVGWRRLTGGAYVEGKIVDRSKRRKPAELTVQIQSASGKVLADTARIPTAATRADPDSFAYRLGGIPRDAGKVRVVVLGDKRKRLASTTVTLAPGAADTHVADLAVG